MERYANVTKQDVPNLYEFEYDQMCKAAQGCIIILESLFLPNDKEANNSAEPPSKILKLTVHAGSSSISSESSNLTELKLSQSIDESNFSSNSEVSNASKFPSNTNAFQNSPKMTRKRLTHSKSLQLGHLIKSQSEFREKKKSLVMISY